jgi:uncharacterized membrane protein YeaQ/YmgE (transglycosylase-associated protein family)
MHYGVMGWILIGLIAGWLAGKITRGKGFGLVANLFLGLVGGVVGGWLFGWLGVHSYGFIGGLAAATVGALLLIVIGRAFAGSREK